MFDFTTEVSRRDMGSLKMMMAPQILKDQGILTFMAGEMDFATAPALTNAVIECAKNGLFSFTLPDDNYYKHVTWWMKKARSWEVEPDWIVTAYGTIMSVATCIRAFVGPGENIIVQPPFYDRYKQAADRLNRGTVYNPLIRVGDTYEMDFAGLEELMQDKRNRLLVLCNPLNPSGKVFKKADLEKVAALSAKYGVYVFSDEIFSEILLEGDPVTPYASIEAGRKYAITATSLGKAFNLTGVNHANIIIPDDDLREAFRDRRTRDHYGSIDPAAYAATIGAYSEEGYEWLLAMTEVIRENSRIVHEAFENYMQQFSVLKNEASFVCWMDFNATGLKGDALSDLLLNKALFHINEGSEYGPGCGGYARMNLGSTKHQTEWAMDRMIRAFGK